MSEALYRKYRPQTFEDVVGQTHIERTLKNAIESDKVSHAYLFCGPRGTGKTTTARLLAKALLCDGGPTPSPDGTCEQCLAIADGVHPDVSELDAASRTGVENVREEIIGRVQYAPTRGRYKIYIIDEVHMLSTAAFNALLKTLEEPPSHVVFVLCTTDPQRVPETIHSRCQRFDFHRLSNDEIVSRLGAVCVAEGVEFEGDALDLIAHRAQGGMRDALTALEQLIAFGGGTVTVEVAQSVLGSIDTDDMSTVVNAIAARDAAACFTWVSEYVETGADLARFARDLAGYVRDLYILALTDGAVALDAPQAARPAMAKEAASFGPDRLAYILRVLGDLSAELRSSVNPRLSFEIALTRMVRPESDLTLDALAARVATLEAALASGSVAASAPAPAAASSASTPGRVQDLPRAEASRFTAPASVPPVASGYRPLSAAAPAPTASAAPAPARASEAADRPAAFRAQLEQRRAAKTAAPVESAPSAAPVPAATPVSATNQAAPSSGQRAAGSLSDDIRAKINDPSALQRGWQAAIADLKRRRAAYGALMLSARIVAQDGGEGLFIEFSRENSFAYSAAQKPDISAAIAASLEGAFGAPVPFAITQGEGASSPARAAMARAAAMRASAPASASAGASQPAVSESTPLAAAQAPAYTVDDAVPYDDADVVPYSDADVESYVPWDGYEDSLAPAPVEPPKGASSRPSRKAEAASRAAATVEHVPQAVAPVSSNARPASVSEPAEPAAASESFEPEVSYDLSVQGPDPVDPYVVGKELGFDSMPAPKKRAKNMIVPTGWPGVDDGKKTSTKRASSARKQAVSDKVDSDSGSNAAEGPRPQEIPAPSRAVEAPSMSPDAPWADELAAASPTRPNPFASREMPAGIGGAAQPAPAPEPESVPTAGTMDAADIFGSFGISFEDVKEEH